MAWKPVVRNRTRIQFENIRNLIDQRFDDVHDELSDCYYNGKPFRNRGILTKEQFDKLHGLIFHIRDIVFHRVNMKQRVKDRIPEEKYDIVYDDAGNFVERKSVSAAARVLALRAEGYELPDIE